MKFIYNKTNVYETKFQIVDYYTFKKLVVLKYCRNKGYEEKGKKQTRITTDELTRISKSRALRNIKEIVACNDFQFFYTQTLNNNHERYNLDAFSVLVRRKFKAYKRKNRNFIYCVVYEKHKNGAFHLHGVVAGLGDDLYKNEYGHYSLKSFEDLGFLNLQAIRTSTEDRKKISSYITKYITKDFLSTSSGSHYFCSKGLKRAKRTMLDDCCLDGLKFAFENDFVKIYDFN